jgi:lipoate-protein ligase A
MRESWRLLATWDGEPGWNMGLDEALLLARDPRPVLRFYTWRPAALSLGYFQRWSALAPLCGREACVRRFSGGGAIHHGDELTFSLAAPKEHALFAGEVRRSYERIHALLVRALQVHGVSARPRGDARLDSDREGSPMCFHASTPLDLAWDGRKGVGSAQRRRGGRVLHHGSIKLAPSALEPGVASLRLHAPRLAAQDLATSIRHAFERELGIAFEPCDPSAGERQHANRRAAFFRSPAFLQRR